MTPRRLAARLATGLATGLAALLAFGPVSAARAQVEIVEESESEQVVERGTVREQGRGVQYGAHLITPVYVADVSPAGGRGASAPIVNPGGGVLGRIGFEFPSGLTAELQVGFGINHVDHACGAGERDCRSRAFTRVDLRGALRYNFLNPTAFVPFVELGLGGRVHFLTFPDRRRVEEAWTFVVHGGVGAQIELTAYFGLELGLLVDYVPAVHDLYDSPGVLGLTPFAGVTLYAYDEDD